MKKNIVVAAILAFFSFTANASSLGFNGAYDYSTWTKGNTGSTADQKSYIDGPQQTLTLMEPDDKNVVGYGCAYDANGCSFDFSHAVSSSGTVSFDWSFNWMVDACCSGFNFLVNSTLYNLADGLPGNKYKSDGYYTKTGTFSVNVNAGDVITFSAFSADACCGAAATTISNFSAPASSVPEPSGIMLLGLGLVMFGLRRRFAA